MKPLLLQMIIVTLLFWLGTIWGSYHIPAEVYFGMPALLWFWVLMFGAWVIYANRASRKL